MQTIRNLYLPCSKPHGTCYMLDSTVFNSALPGSQLMDFQRNLASIIALTQPVSNECNPFFVNKFFRNYAYYGWNWQCKDKCKAAQTLASSSMDFTYQPGTQPSWIGGGCILCNHAFNNGGLTCSKNTEKELLIGFANSQVYHVPDANTCKKYHRVVIGTIKDSQWNNLAAWASPGLAYQVKIKVNNNISIADLSKKY